MANRKRKQRAFTLPDSFTERLSAMAKLRDTTMSQLIQEYGEKGLRTEEFVVKLHKQGTFGHLKIEQVLSDEQVLDIARAFVTSRDAGDHHDANMMLQEWLEWNQEYISTPQDEA